MYYVWLTVFLALVVFVLRLPATIRRIKAQREALRPVPPVSGIDHLPCIVNTIGAVLTEFTLLGLLTFAVFLGSNAALGTLDSAPDFSSGMRQVSFGALLTIAAVSITTLLLIIGVRFAGHALILLIAFGLVAWMVMSSVGDEWPAVAIFGLIAYGAPALLVLLLRGFR